MNKSLYEIQMATILKRAGYKFVEEYRFTPPRRFRFDFVILPIRKKIAVEVEGGSYLPMGRHGYGKGFQSDCEKYNLAVILGWKILRYVPDNLTDVLIDLKTMSEKSHGFSRVDESV